MSNVNAAGRGERIQRSEGLVKLCHAVVSVDGRQLVSIVAMAVGAGVLEYRLECSICPCIDSIHLQLNNHEQYIHACDSVRTFWHH